MKKATILSLLMLFFISYSYSQWTVSSVPDPKSTGDSFVSNPDGIITNSEVSFLDSLIQQVNNSSKAEVAVVILSSIGTRVPKVFATDLLNYWGVGNAETNNGLLILFVLDQRRIEFEAGYGVEQILTDGKAYEIQQEFMVPYFKEGNYGQGIIEGVQEIVRILLQNEAELKPSGEGSNTSENKYINEYGNQSETNTDYSILYLYLKITAFFCGIFIIFLIISAFIRNYFVRYQTLRIFRLYIWFILFPIPFIGIYIFVKSITEKWRNTPRVSSRTGKIMHKLSEEEDDQYLEKGQIAEEKVKYVDYDVWVSGEEGDVLIQSYKRWFSKYNSCPKCKFKTYYKESDKIITAPTYSSSGTGERRYKCTNCGHSKIVRYRIPKKSRTSSTSSSSSSWGSSSSSWSSGGGSSWGGGSSGGGGAGSSW